jgi:DNA helicase-2/ATP-dependent DNA helicase PcrA
MIDYKNELNNEQYEAVTTNNGPLLVLAGAGTGKTRVITYKMAYLIEELNIPPNSILSVTFTNKAADEMKERLLSLIGNKSKSVWCGTFHSIALRMLRQKGDAIGLVNGFGIVDQDDRVSLLRSILKELNIDPKKYSPKLYLSLISSFKNTMEFVEEQMPPLDDSVLKLAEVFSEYQKRLKEINSIDFDDMLSLAIRMFMKKPEINNYYKNIFKHILVDEYQDTNFTQFIFLKQLSGKNGNICVVGDDDQSIYGWRGAEIRNILDFDKFFENVKTVTLVKNYRSTPKILFSANTLISCNKYRKKKVLQPVTDEMGCFEIINYQNGQEEAFGISMKIKQLLSENKNLDDIAILYRTNAQSRNFEIELNKSGIPYKVIGGIGFYQRKEVKDILSYLKFFDNPFDIQSFSRSIKAPSRKIGNATIEKLIKYAFEKGTDIPTALRFKMDKMRNKESISAYLKIFSELEKLDNIQKMIKTIIDLSDYYEYLKKTETKQDAENKIANLEELINAAAEFEEKNEDSTLSDFLSSTTLYTSSDENSNNNVKLMTIHSAKGLEFDTVFLTGLEDGLFPLFRAYEDPTGMELEEERRLCYVGITRAKRNLYLSYASSRMTYGNWKNCKQSIFLKELHIIQKKNQKEIIKKKNEYQNNKKINDFYDGEKVFHKKFGEGMVISSTGSGDNAKIDVFFKQRGLKKIVARFLQKI